MARLVALAAGVDSKHLDKAIATYLDELTQLRYAAVAPQRQAQKRDSQLLSRVAGLSSSAG